MELTNLNEPVIVTDSELNGSSFSVRRVTRGAASRTPDCSPRAFDYVDMSDVAFSRMNMSRATFTDGLLPGTRFVDVNMSGVRIENANARRTERSRTPTCPACRSSDCDIAGLRVDGYLVSDLIAAYRKNP